MCRWLCCKTDQTGNINSCDVQTAWISKGQYFFHVSGDFKNIHSFNLIFGFVKCGSERAPTDWNLNQIVTSFSQKWYNDNADWFCLGQSKQKTAAVVDHVAPCSEPLGKIFGRGLARSRFDLLALMVQDPGNSIPWCSGMRWQQGALPVDAYMYQVCYADHTSQWKMLGQGGQDGALRMELVLKWLAHYEVNALGDSKSNGWETWFTKCGGMKSLFSMAYGQPQSKFGMPGCRMTWLSSSSSWATVVLVPLKMWSLKLCSSFRLTCRPLTQSGKNCSCAVTQWIGGVLQAASSALCRTLFSSLLHVIASFLAGRFEKLINYNSCSLRSRWIKQCVCDVLAADQICKKKGRAITKRVEQPRLQLTKIWRPCTLAMACLSISCPPFW